MAEEQKIVRVKIIAVPGYSSGVVTTMNSFRAQELAKTKKVEVLGEQKVANKKAPAANDKK
jgi:hypothetical protein